jgi:dolichol-phosphate mannosyltransferase
MQHFDINRIARVEQQPLELTLVVPVLNERDNIEPLLDRLALALAGIEWEVLFVDDRSSDGTPELVEAIAQQDRRVRLVRRFGRRGLASAVLEGFLSSVAPVVAVIDGDMQHDESLLPRLYEAIAKRGNDLAVGTRYMAGGGTGDWDERRRLISRIATALAAPVMKTSLADPMSGFFAVKRQVVLEAAPQMSSVGYKVLLDLVASSPRKLAVAELPYTFAKRSAGESKLDGAVILEYFELILDKLIGRWIPVKLLMFGAVGAVGVVVHLALLGVLLHGAGIGFAWAQTAAVLGSMIFNFYLNNEFTYRDRRLRGLAWLWGLASFSLVCGVGAIANVGAGTLLYEADGQWWLAALFGATIGSVWNFVGTSWLTWTRRRT